MDKKTLLVVDDQKSNIDVMMGILTQFHVIVSLNAMNALEVLEKQNVDMILLDVMMPDMDGFELCEIIKSKEAFVDIPILFITAKSDVKSIEKAYSIGGVDYVTKPFYPKELLARVNTHLKLRDIQLNLETRVAEGIAKIQVQDALLLERAKLAEMGEMVDAIAHQWTQPLSLINMRLYSLKYDYQDNLVTDQYIETMTEKSLDQINYMMDTLQEFRSFLSTDKEYEEFDAKSMVSSCLLLLNEELHNNNIFVEFIVNENFVISAVENEVQQIIINILNNAKDALIENGSSVNKIKIIVNEKQIEIMDNGPGISPYVIDSIFLSNISTKKHSGGSGMGLYISQKIAQKFSIKLSVENIAQGASFKMKFTNC